MFATEKRDLSKTKSEKTSAQADAKGHTEERVQVNPLWHQLAARVQAKPSISAPNDPYEQEANRVADQVMRVREPILQPKCSACAAGSAIYPGYEEGIRIHRKLDGAAKTGEVPADFASQLGGGTALDSASRAFFEPLFDRDFSDVRVHADTQADTAARTINARAFTLGRNIVFRMSQYAPHSESGRRLLAHELTHIAQQQHNITPSRHIQRKIMVDANTISENLEFAERMASLQTVAGITAPSLNGTTVLEIKDFKGDLSKASWRIDWAEKAIHAPLIDAVPDEKRGFRCFIKTVPDNKIASTLYIAKPIKGPWVTVTAKENISKLHDHLLAKDPNLKLPQLKACQAKGDTKFRINSRPNDTAFGQKILAHEEHHASDFAAVFKDLVGTWDSGMVALDAKDSLVFSHNQKACPLAAYFHIGQKMSKQVIGWNGAASPERIAANLTQKLADKTDEFHKSKEGHFGTVEGMQTNQDCSESSLTLSL